MCLCVCLATVKTMLSNKNAEKLCKIMMERRVKNLAQTFIRLYMAASLAMAIVLLK